MPNDDVRAWRRVSDLLLKMDLLETALESLQREAGAHHIKNIEQRIAAAHKRLNELEAGLRARAAELGQDERAPLRDLRRRLRTLGRRREASNQYAGVERRQAGRRRGERSLVPEPQE